VQLAVLAPVLNDWLGHDAHTRSAVGVPSFTMKVPGPQTVIATHGVAELRSSSKVPAAHETAGAVLPEQYWPGRQSWQMVGDVAVPAAVCTVPAAQVPSGKQLDWLSPLEYSPSAQATHTRSTVLEGVLLTKLPSVHEVHEAQVVAFEAVLYWPLAHGAQRLSVVAVPGVAT
jgi:hypothetical protein